MAQEFAPSSIHILIVDDELSVRQSLQSWFSEDGYTVDTAEDATVALGKMQNGAWDIILLDIKMPGMDGLTLMEKIRERNLDVIIIIITAYATVDTAVRALKEGAFDYVTKPVDPDELTHLIRNAVRQRMLTKENVILKEKVDQLQAHDIIIGDSPQIRKVIELVKSVAQTDVTVIIRGESGTGKELIARAIHANSKRRYFPIIPVNCGALTETLLESELFGHEKGAFTGAQYRRKGRLEMANGGTLFLDEVGTLGMKTQIDLLRVFESKQFTRVGGEKTIKVDFRIICATNADLEQAVHSGSFREDLYYRLNVFSIVIPPLRERRSDIPELATYFVKKYSMIMNKAMKEIAPAAMDVLVQYHWPGNVRELENAIERAMVVGKPPLIQPHDLPIHLNEENNHPKSDSLWEIEKAHIGHVLEKFNDNITRAAEALNIDRVTLYNKIEKYGLKRRSHNS